MLRLALITLVLVMLMGCGGAEEAPVMEDTGAATNSKNVDPLQEARARLFGELGIEENKVSQKSTEEELPVVLPTPPELPKTDADLE